jgi:UDP-N-acetylglucosamine 2-epimerase (non-hydrolysing)
LGTNVLIGTNPDAIKPAIEILNSGNWKTGKVPHLWDGKAAERIINQLLKL